MSKGRCFVRDYEIVYIFHPSIDEEKVNEKLDKLAG